MRVRANLGHAARTAAPWALGLLLTSCATPDRTPDVLLVTIDTLRADRWGCLGNPAVRSPCADRLARGGLLAFEGRAPAPLTLPSHTSMMTGLSPAQHGVRDNGIFALPPDGPPTLASVFQANGWTTAAFISAFPLARRFGLDRGFDTYDEFLRGGEDDEGFTQMRERTADDALARVSRYFERRRPDPSRPLFVWVHFFDPHAEYRAPAPWPALSPRAPYDAEVAYVDRALGRLGAILDDARPGRTRRLVVASDHGESLGEHGEATHGVLLHTATIRVPIVVRDERYAPRLLGTPAPLETVARTTLDLAGLHAGLDSAAAPDLAAFAGPVHAETLYPAFNFRWRGLRAWEEGGWRLVASVRDRLYRTDTDPAETNDVAAENPEIVARLHRTLESEWPEGGAGALLGARSTSPEETDALRSLGYLGGSGPGPGSIDELFRTGPDPEAQVGLLDAVNLGITRLDAGDAAAAESTLARVVDADPGNRLAWEYLGRAQLARNELTAARTTLQRTLALGPNPSAVYLDLARVERELGDPDAAWKVLERALRADPNSMVARQEMSRIRMERGDVPGATRLLEEAVEVRPRSAPTRAALARLYEAAGRKDDAAQQWRRVLELEPDGPIAADARGALGSTAPPPRPEGRKR